MTAFVGWDPSGGNAQQEPTRNLEEADLYEFLEERQVEGTFNRLRFMGVESPADLWYLYIEDLVELGISLEDAKGIMKGIHPPGTVRPDNPNGISLTTGEVCLFDRDHRQLPRFIQNRTLSHSAPGPPVQGVGINTQGLRTTDDPYLEDWQDHFGIAPDPVGLPAQRHLPVDLTEPGSSTDAPPLISAISIGSSFGTPGAAASSSSSGIQRPTASRRPRVVPPQPRHLPGWRATENRLRVRICMRYIP